MIARLVNAIVNALSENSKPAPEDDEIINNDGGFINVTFEDGTDVSFAYEDLVSEYVTLRVMYHSNFDFPSMIPYIGVPFDYEVFSADDD